MFSKPHSNSRYVNVNLAMIHFIDSDTLGFYESFHQVHKPKISFSYSTHSVLCNEYDHKTDIRQVLDLCFSMTSVFTQ